MNTPLIHVWEGPAGAGKSTAIAASDAPVLMADFFPRPRQLPGEAEIFPVARDLTHYMMALQSPEPEVNLDRFILSGWVYNSLRLGIEPALDDLVAWCSLSSDQLRATHALVQRGLYHERVSDPPQVRCHLLLPEPEVLAKRRSGSGKEYPMDAWEELRRYQFIAENYQFLDCLGWQFWVHTIESQGGNE